MMPPSTTPSVGEARRHQEGHGYGMVLFASILLLVIGCFNLIQGIAAAANSHVFVANAHYVVGNLRAWGWITLIFGVLQLLAAAGALVRGGGAGAECHRPDVLHPRLPVLGADHYRHGRGRPVGAVRLRQPR